MTTTILPKISLPSTLSTMTSHYHPKLVAILNSSIEFRVSKMRGPFLWHAHHSTDELYYVLDGGPFILKVRRVFDDVAQGRDICYAERCAAFAVSGGGGECAVCGE
jgi:hypothetical protein